MAPKLILDGYNVIHKIPYLAGFLSKGLQEAREALIRWMAEWRRSRNAEVVIVFDRRKDVLADAPVRSSQKVNGVSFVFTTPGIEADDEIIKIIRREKNPVHVIVVSDDGKICNNAKALGVKIMPPSFLDHQPQRSGKLPREAEKKNLSPGRENDITRWYMAQLGRKQD